jgi:hypothetical protein
MLDNCIILVDCDKPDGIVSVLLPEGVFALVCTAGVFIFLIMVVLLNELIGFALVLLAAWLFALLLDRVKICEFSPFWDTFRTYKAELDAFGLFKSVVVTMLDEEGVGALILFELFTTMLDTGVELGAAGVTGDFRSLVGVLLDSSLFVLSVESWAFVDNFNTLLELSARLTGLGITRLAGGGVGASPAFRTAG